MAARHRDRKHIDSQEGVMSARTCDTTQVNRLNGPFLGGPSRSATSAQCDCGETDRMNSLSYAKFAIICIGAIVGLPALAQPQSIIPTVPAFTTRFQATPM